MKLNLGDKVRVHLYDSEFGRSLIDETTEAVVTWEGYHAGLRDIGYRVRYLRPNGSLGTIAYYMAGNIELIQPGFMEIKPDTHVTEKKVVVEKKPLIDMNKAPEIGPSARAKSNAKRKGVSENQGSMFD